MARFYVNLAILFITIRGWLPSFTNTASAANDAC